MSDEFGWDRCVEFEERINDLIDSRLPLIDDLELGKHARECAKCDQLLEDYLQVLGPGLAQQLQPHQIAASLALTPPVDSQLTPASKPIQWSQPGRWKVFLSLAPSFGALLIVSISIWMSADSSRRAFVGPTPNWSAVQSVVAQNSYPEVRSGEQEHRSMLNWSDASHPLASPLLTQARMIDGVQECSSAFYQLANDHSPLHTYRLAQHQMVYQVAMPHQPLHHQLCYRGEFSAIPQLRFFVGFAVQLIQQAFSNEINHPADLGLFLRPWLNSRCA